MRYLLPAVVAAAALAAGCGGHGASKHYTRAAVAHCLQQHGLQAVPSQAPLVSWQHAPGGSVDVVHGASSVGLAFAKDSHGAHQLAMDYSNAAAALGGGADTVGVRGNVAVVGDPHVVAPCL